MAFNINTSVQEAAARFASQILTSMNSAAAEVAGVDVMWFRAMPDKKSQDVLFQNYTLFGVEDCPLEFKAIYTESNYDDAGMIYGVFGTEYITPFYIEISRNTWESVTDNDGTLPQQQDIVFIPQSRKLLQVKSMVPIKQLGAQLTGYKVSLEEYKPTRSRLVGENLKNTIEESTVNLDSVFGKDIESTIKDIVDDNQLSVFTSTEKDKYKKVEATYTEESARKMVRCIVTEDLIVDGHVCARSHYDLSKAVGIAVSYSITDSVSKDNSRCFSCWAKLPDVGVQDYKNIKNISYTYDSKGGYITTSLGKSFNIGDEVILERGIIKVIGVVSDTNLIKISIDDVRRLHKISENWYSLPGFVLKHSYTNVLLSGKGSKDLQISIRGKSFICVELGNKLSAIQLQNELADAVWNAIIVNMEDGSIQVDTYSGDNNIVHSNSITLKTKVWKEHNIDNFYIPSSSLYLTNIRYYDTVNKDIDSQIKDIASYNVANNSHLLINDSADTYLNKPYTGKQR